MAPPLILSSSDVGAPPLTGEDGSLYEILKWALPQFGWTIEFDSDDSDYKIVFRNDDYTGSGHYIRVVDRASLHGSNGRQASVRAYVSMTDIDSGIGETPTIAHAYMSKSGTADSIERQYIIIGDPRRFFWFPATSVGGTLFHFFGDLITTDIDPDDSAFVFYGNTAIPNVVKAAAVMQFAPAVTATGGLYLTQDFSGNSYNIPAHFYCPLFNPLNASAIIPGTVGTVVHPRLGKARFTRAWVQHTTFCRGYIPYVYFPFGDWVSLYGSDANRNLFGAPPLELEVDGVEKEFYLFAPTRNVNGYTDDGAFLLDFTEDWE